MDKIRTLAAPDDHDKVESILSSLDALALKPIPIQVGAGTGSGIFAGYLFGKSSKIVAVIAGVSVICLLFAQRRGYIIVQTDRLEKDVNKLANRARKVIEANARNAKVPAGFSSRYTYIIGGFVAGCLFGYALS